jgi:Outer membrane protein beta-barrel domain
MRKFLLAALLLALLALPLMAQDSPKAEVFGGYQFQYLGGDFSSINGGSGIKGNGWDASLTGNINKHFGVTGDFSGAYKTISGVSGHLYTYGGGPVIAADFGGKINPFVHVVVGGYTFDCGSGCLGGSSSSTNGFMMKFGGGVDVKVAKVIAIRLAQFDWDYYRVKGTSEDKNVNISTGIVLRF